MGAFQRGGENCISLHPETEIHPSSFLWIQTIKRANFLSGRLPQQLNCRIVDIDRPFLDLAQDEGVAESGYRLIVNNGPEAGQVVFHLHMHLMGGRQMRGLG